MDNVIASPDHLNYYRLLEKDLDQCFRFIEPCETHHGVYSDEFARIILMAASGVENALNSFAAILDVSLKRPIITSSHSLVTRRFEKFCSTEMFLPRSSLILMPWRDWSSKSAPDWWALGYNKIKHDRVNHPDAATFLRAVYSVAALQVLLLHLYRLQGGKEALVAGSSPRVIVLYERQSSVPGLQNLFSFELPDDH